MCSFLPYNNEDQPYMCVCIPSLLGFPPSYFHPTTAHPFPDNYKMVIRMLRILNCVPYPPVWRMQWHPTPILSSGKSHGWRSLVGCSMGSLRVGQDWATSLWLFTFMHWRRKWQPIPMFLPGESQGWGSCLWGCTESDMAEGT